MKKAFDSVKDVNYMVGKVGDERRITMATLYTVWGISPVRDGTAEIELFSSYSQNEAIRWATQYIRGDATLGGHSAIEVAHYNADCEYTAIYVVRADGSAEYVDECDEYSFQSAISYNL